MKTLLIILLIILSPVSFLHSQSGWFTQPSGTSKYLYDVYFISENTGWTVGQTGTILKTINAGTNWIQQSSVDTSFLYSVFFIDVNSGWIAGKNGSIFKTTNGGTNWFSQNSNVSADLYCVCFTDVNFGYICGTNGTILKTINGGTNWNLIPSGTTNPLYCVNFPSSAVSTTGYISGGSESQGIVLKTQNQGNNWSMLYVGYNWIYGVCFTDYNQGWCVGFNSTLYSTSNGGSNWEVQAPPLIDGLVSVYFVNNYTGWISGFNGTILNTTNSGTDWIQQESGTTENLWAIHFVNSQSGWAVGWNGKIIHTTNGGVTGIQKIGSAVPTEFELQQNYPNPFNPSTKIKFNVPQNKEQIVRIEIFDALGKKLDELLNKKITAGYYEILWNAENYPCGVYFCRLETQTFSQTKKMVLVK
jgi:photosystem II stability/assembly factor-like uncharacterized protein